MTFQPPYHPPKSSPNNPSIIIARFTNRDIRNLIFQKRKLIGVRDYGIDGMTNLFINKNLIPRRKKLFSFAYKKSTSKYQFPWTYNGDIFIRKNTT